MMTLISRCAKISAKVFGVVLNNVNVRSHDYYYDYQRYYHQAYYSKDVETEKVVTEV